MEELDLQAWQTGLCSPTALPLVFALPSRFFYEIPFVRRMSSRACVCIQRFRACLQHCKQPQYTGVVVSCTKHSHQLPVCPDWFYTSEQQVDPTVGHKKTRERWSKFSFILKMVEFLCCLNCSHEQPSPSHFIALFTMTPCFQWHHWHLNSFTPFPPHTSSAGLAQQLLTVCREEPWEPREVLLQKLQEEKN